MAQNRKPESHQLGRTACLAVTQDLLSFRPGREINGLIRVLKQFFQFRRHLAILVGEFAQAPPWLLANLRPVTPCSHY